MKLRWRIFAWLFREDYDLLFDVMHEYQDIEHAEGPDAFDPPVWEFHDRVEFLGVRMGCWSAEEVTIWSERRLS